MADQDYPLAERGYDAGESFQRGGYDEEAMERQRGRDPYARGERPYYEGERQQGRYEQRQGRPGSNFSNPGQGAGSWGEGSNANRPGWDDQDRGYGRESQYSRWEDQGRRTYGERMGGYSGEGQSYGMDSGYAPGSSRPGYGGGQYGGGARYARGGQRRGSQPYGVGQYGGDQPYGSGQIGSPEYGGQQFGSGQYGGRQSASGYGREGGYPAGRQAEAAGYGSSIGGLGQYSGRGPKGYQRSDDRIREDVCETLTMHPQIDASEVEVRVQGGDVTLTGSVGDRGQKRYAEDALDGIAGVKEVNNQLRVSQHSHEGQGGSSQGGSKPFPGTAQDREMQVAGMANGGHSGEEAQE